MINSARRPVLVAAVLCVDPLPKAHWCSVPAARKGQSPAVYLLFSAQFPRLLAAVLNAPFVS